MSHDTNKKMLDREAVRSVIQQWNANRLDLFALSEPDENLLFHGVMRFYFQDAGQKVATKCIRVASDATVIDVIDTLIEKFRPDMRMLSVPNYALYEVHANGEERRLNPDEKPLLVQLNWHIDDREGRFLLKNIDQKTTPIEQNDINFKRKLSKREKKEQKKKDKLAKLHTDGSNTTTNSQSNGLNGSHGTEGDTQVAGKLYTELPETSFTRSISNPEAVMRRRRQQKLEKKLQQFRSRDGGPDTGGTLKIYGESLCQDVPYKTLLLSIRDCAQAVVREMLTKYGLEKTDPLHYCLVQVNSDGSEYILDDDECPLSILMNHPTSRGSIMFHVRRRPADSQPRRRKKKPLGASNGANNISQDREGPMLVEVTHSGDGGRRLKLGNDPIEVGSANTNCLQLFGPSIQARHCLISLVEGVCTVTPLHADALTFVNGHHISQPTILHNGSVVMFGRVASYRFVDSPTDGRYNLALSQSQLDSACLYESRSPASPGSWNDEDGALSSTHKSDYDPHNVNASDHTEIDGNLRSSNGSDSKNQPGGGNFHGGSSGGGGGGGGGGDTQSLEGNLENETKSISSLKSGGSNSQERSPKMPLSSTSAAAHIEPQGQEPILPAVLEFPETHQEFFLRHIITELDVNAPHFKLAPVYSLYLCARYRASTHYRPELQPTERAHKLTIFLHHVANLIYNVVQEQYTDPRILAFWMANSSEFLHFLKSDRHISAFSVQAQEVLAESVQTAFRNLVNCFRVELSQTLNQFLSETIDHDSAAGLVLTVLGSAMALLRRCRVNAALTIQLFSQLFHYINVICFNTIVANSHMCTAEWGKVMTERLQLLELWAERQGLELAADCHLAKINQCAQFLQAPKTSVEEIQQLACSCFRLNSLQMAALLQQEKIPRNLVDTAIRMAESVADELTRADGREVRLEESPELHLALLLPDDGFSCDVVRGIPSGLVDFLNPLQQQGMCRLAAQPTSIGLWTVYMHQFNARSSSAMSNKLPQPEVQVIKLHKNSNGMGLSIVAAKGAGQERLGIYIKSVVPGGAADADGRLQAGDQLLRVDGQSLIGITQERAADYLVRTGPVVTLDVAKQGAIYHGLATLLQQPSPVIQREEMPPPMQTLQFPHPQQRRHSSHNTSRYYSSISDDSLNRSRRESFAGIYASSSSPPMRRLSASSLLEERCQMGYQIPIDPRYRDTRPIARSASSLYNMSKEVSLSTHNLTNTLGGGMMMHQHQLPLQHQIQPPTLHPQMHVNPLRKRARSISNTNINNTPPPSIYIEEYMEPGEQSSAAKTNSQESFTNFVYTEVHQPLNEEGIASVSNAEEEIPFIDDGSPTEEEKPYVPLPIPPQHSKSIISNRKASSSTSLINQRKTVSFDLEDDENKPLELAASINRKFHTHDAISNYCRDSSSKESLARDSNSSLDKDKDKEKVTLIQKIRRELNSYRSTSGGDGNNSGGSNSNSNRSSSESIEKMPLLTQRFREISMEPRRELNSIRSTSSRATNLSYNGYNKLQQQQQQQQQQLMQKRFINNANHVNQIKPSDQVILHPKNRTTQNVNTNLKQSPRFIPNTTSNVSVSESAFASGSASVSASVSNKIIKPCQESNLKEKSLSQSNIDYLEFKEFSIPYGQGKVKEMAEFFTQNKDFKLQPFALQQATKVMTPSPTQRLSKSTSDLLETPLASKRSMKKPPLLTQHEQCDIIKQLKEWSIFGLEGRDFEISLKNAASNSNSSSSSIQSNEIQQRISLNNCCLNTCNNNHNHSHSHNHSNINNNHACNEQAKCETTPQSLLATPCKFLTSLSTSSKTTSTSKAHLNVNCDSQCCCLSTKCCCCSYMENCTETCTNTKCTCCCHDQDRELQKQQQQQQLKDHVYETPETQHESNDDEFASVSNFEPTAATTTPSTSSCTSPTGSSSTFRRCGTLTLCPKSKSVRSVKRKQQKQTKLSSCSTQARREVAATTTPSATTTGSPSRCKVLLSLASSLNAPDDDNASVTTTSTPGAITTSASGKRTCSSTCPHCCVDFENDQTEDVIDDGDTNDNDDDDVYNDNEDDNDDVDDDDEDVCFDDCEAVDDNLDDENMTS
uniref:Afadin n=1 Tax=Stomoxys calcitrans TaxID=35570 RepID=A0A1I8P1F7_STOCA